MRHVNLLPWKIVLKRSRTDGNEMEAFVSSSLYTLFPVDEQLFQTSTLGLPIQFKDLDNVDVYKKVSIKCQILNVDDVMTIKGGRCKH